MGGVRRGEHARRGPDDVELADGHGQVAPA